MPKVRQIDIEHNFVERREKVLHYDLKCMKPFIQAFYPNLSNKEFRSIYNFRYYPSFDHDILRMLEDVIERIEIAKKLTSQEIKKAVLHMLEDEVA